MKRLFTGVAVFFLVACAHFPQPIGTDNAHMQEENLSGEHAALASCAVGKLQSDGRSFMRVLQFRNRSIPDTGVSEIHAFDRRYLPNVYATSSPLNPDAVLEPLDSNPETLPYIRRNKNGEPIYAFALILRQIDDRTVHATLKGDQFMGSQAWKILQWCVSLRPQS